MGRLGVQVSILLFMSQAASGGTRRLLWRPPPPPVPALAAPFCSVTCWAGCRQRDAAGELLEGAVGPRYTMSLGPGPVSGR